VLFRAGKTAKLIKLAENLNAGCGGCSNTLLYITVDINKKFFSLICEIYLIFAVRLRYNCRWFY
jgi:hypothetical protein